jgi:hypothetical protein
MEWSELRRSAETQVLRLPFATLRVAQDDKSIVFNCPDVVLSSTTRAASYGDRMTLPGRTDSIGFMVRVIGSAVLSVFLRQTESKDLQLQCSSMRLTSDSGRMSNSARPRRGKRAYRLPRTREIASAHWQGRASGCMLVVRPLACGAAHRAAMRQFRSSSRNAAFNRE